LSRKFRGKSLESFLIRNKNQELTGQSSGKHYRTTKKDKVECSWCPNSGKNKLVRHRINPYKEFIDENVIIICTSCHGVIQKTINTLKEYGAEINYNLAIMLAKTEVLKSLRNKE
jgi:hypothetical protein